MSNMVKNNICKRKQYQSGQEIIRGELRLIHDEVKKMKIYINQQKRAFNPKFTKPILLSI